MEKVNWDDMSFLISSSYREKVLKSIETPKTPSQISKELSINIAHISRALSELEDRKMVKCLTPTAIKGKLFVATEYGKIAIKSKQINIK
jgi:predicted transcriptional regulator